MVCGGWGRTSAPAYNMLPTTLPKVFEIPSVALQFKNRRSKPEQLQVCVAVSVSQIPAFAHWLCTGRQL